MDFPRPFLALFCFAHLPAYSQYLTIEQLASAIGFAVFAMNELAKLYGLVVRKIRARRARRRKRMVKMNFPAV